MEQKEEALERLMRQLEEAVRSGKEMWESPEVQDKVDEIRNHLRKYLKEYPVGTIAVSVASGFLLAKLISRSRKRREE